MSGRKKPIDFRTLGKRVEMNYRNMLHRIGKYFVYSIIFIEFENKMINQIKPTIPGSPDIFKKQANILKECISELRTKTNEYFNERI